MIVNYDKCTIFLIQVPFVPSNHITLKGMNFRCGKLPHCIEYYRLIWGLTYSPTWYDQANCIQSVSSRDNNPDREDPFVQYLNFCWVKKRNLLYLVWSDLFIDRAINLTFWCQHTSYLSILVHRRIIEVYKKYTKKLSELATK